ncbi:carboxymuconolactone decarboxylase family protein [Streptomyces thinghirensis]|nr:carboxymuconolactone decarboxylase family protein [Streptomyces thinghirensis]
MSQANKCRFCVDAHTMLLHATGDHALAEQLWPRVRTGRRGSTRVLDGARRTRVPGPRGERPSVPARGGPRLSRHRAGLPLHQP